MKRLDLIFESKFSHVFQEKKELREAVPDNAVASLQEELAAVKLREAEANLALKDLKAKVAELNNMWQKHLLKQRGGDGPKADGASSDGPGMAAVVVVPSTPKRLLGSLLEGKSEAARLEEELMTARLCEVEAQAELKEQRLKVMELETQVGPHDLRIVQDSP